VVLLKKVMTVVFMAGAMFKLGINSALIKAIFDN